MLDARAMNLHYCAPEAIVTRYITLQGILNRTFNYREKFIAVPLKLAGAYAEDA